MSHADSLAERRQRLAMLWELLQGSIEEPNPEAPPVHLPCGHRTDYLRDWCRTCMQHYQVAVGRADRQESPVLRDLARLPDHQARGAVWRWESAPFWVDFQGPIGCGKTECIKQVRFPPGVRVVMEPVARDAPDSWHDALVRLYHWIERRSQSRAAGVEEAHGGTHGNVVLEVESMIWEHHKRVATAPRLQPLITERSCESTVYVFSKELCRMGLLEPAEFAAFVAEYEQVARDPMHQPDLILKFNVPPFVAQERIKKRAVEEDRIFEMEVPLEYLENVTNEYDRVYLHRSNVLELNADEPTDGIIFEVREKVAWYLQDRCPPERKAAIRAFLACLPP